MTQISFDDTKVAFLYKSDRELKNARWLFRAINMPFFSKMGMKLALWGNKMSLPNKTPMMKALYHQFCGGETMQDAYFTGEKLLQYQVGIILDYSVEAQESEEDFDESSAQFIRTIEYASQKSGIPYVSIKITALARFGLLEKMHAKESLTIDEVEEWEKAQERIRAIVRTGVQNKTKVLIDAEESWIQGPIDQLVYELMKTYNKDQAWVFSTYQMYRTDRLNLLKKELECAKKFDFKLGAKIVRGAYMEKERIRAANLNYPSPIQIDKSSTDRDFNSALLLCAKHIDNVELFIGTHNEYSCKKTVELIDAFKLDPSKVCFSQLYGMSDHISFNLAKAGFTVVKYLPYGHMKDAIPYLLRRAQENTSVKGQSSRELQLIETEIKRRKKTK